MMMKLTLGIFSAMGFACLVMADQEKPNIILVMADDQGYGDMGYTGHPFVQTPQFDKMAKNSVVFDRFYAAAPVCSPTRASVMTGRHPMRVNVPQHGHYLRPHEHTVAELMKKAGYVTGHFGKWHIGSVQPESATCPGKVGFDEWETGLNFYDQNPYLSQNGKYLQKKGQGTVLNMDSTLAFLKKHKDGDKPIFAVTWFPSPHDPHKEVPVQFPGGKNLYKDKKAGRLRGYFLEITLMDQQMGRLRRAVRDMGIEKNTIIWYCSDNGGLDPRSSGGRAKKGSIYEGGLRVPAMIEWPSHWSARKVEVPANTSDIYPTLSQIVGVKMDQQPPLDGVSLLPIIEGKKSERPAMGFWHGYTDGQPTWNDVIIKKLMVAQQAGKPTPYPERIHKNVYEFPTLEKGAFQGHAAWNNWPWKLHRIQDGKKVKIELYNLQKDPMEKTNVAAANKDKVRTLRGELEKWQASVFDSWQGKDYSSSLREQKDPVKNK